MNQPLAAQPGRLESAAGGEPLSALAGPPASRVRYGVLGILCAAATIAYIQRYAINTLRTPIGTDLHLDLSATGSVMSGFFAAYALLQIPSGWLGERWGSRRALTLYAVLWSLLTGSMCLVSGKWSLLAVWSLVGAAQAGLFPCAMIAVRDWLPASRRALASGMLASCMSLGGALSPAIVGWLSIDLGRQWPAIYALLALPGLVWAMVYFAWFRDRPEVHPQVNAQELAIIRGLPAPTAAEVAGAEPAGHEPTDNGPAGNELTAPGPVERLPWQLLLGSLPMWLICFQQFFRAAAQVLFGTWFGTYLQQSPGLSEREVAYLAGAPLVMLIIGGVLGGTLSDWILARTGSRRWARQGFSVVNLLACAALFAAAGAAREPYLAVLLVSMASLAMALGGVSAFAITMDMGGAHVAIVFSIMNMAGSIGSALFPKFVGWLLETTHNWNHVMLAIAMIYLAAAVCWLLLNPNGSVFDRPASRKTEPAR